ncbi:DUF2461 domain-containing protein [Flavobacterium sp. XS1P32]|uniref:DUF2461 domain-containing protein n=1 Tax=Flavobacterium sp. XS1P32 TaxID=3401726 RepID=UPI003AAB7EC4
MLSKDTLQFLDDLKANNNRDWFLDNKKRYEAFKKDYQLLVADLLDAMKPLDPSLEMLEVKNCTFRINRDIRFSKDKTLYKSHLGIWLSSGAKGLNRSGYYIHLENGSSFIAGGLYCPEANDLKKMRKEIAYFHEDLEAILNEKEFKKEFNDFDRDEKNTLKNPPRGYEKEHPAIDLLKLKSFESSQKINFSTAGTKDFVTTVSKKLILLKPLNDFINRALTSD